MSCQEMSCDFVPPWLLLNLLSLTLRSQSSPAARVILEHCRRLYLACRITGLSRNLILEEERQLAANSNCDCVLDCQLPLRLPLLPCHRPYLSGSACATVSAWNCSSWWPSASDRDALPPGVASERASFWLRWRTIAAHCCHRNVNFLAWTLHPCHVEIVLILPWNLLGLPHREHLDFHGNRCRNTSVSDYPQR